MGIGVISITTNQRRDLPTPATVTAADQGLSLTGTTVRLGQAVGAVGNPAQVNADREIPFDLFVSLNLITTALPAATLQMAINPLLFNWTFDSTAVQPQFQMLATDTGESFNIFYDPATPTFFFGAPGVRVTCESFALFNIGGGSAAATAQLEIGGGGNNAFQGQLKFRGPNLLVNPEAGVMEFDGTNIFFTRVAPTRENILTGNAGAAAPATTIGGVPANFFGTGGVNYLGTPNNWVQVNIGGVTFKIPLYT